MIQEPPEKEGRPKESRFPALAYPNFKRFLFGTFISNLGNRLQTWAIFWHIYHLTGSSFAVGAVGLVRVVPLLFFGLFGGVLADRCDRRTIQLVTICLQAVVALGLAVATLKGETTVLVLYVAVGLSAIAMAFNNPSRQAMVANLVPLDVFSNAASLNGIQWRLSDILGPMMAGGFIAAFASNPILGLGLAYLTNTISFSAVLWALWRLPAQPRVSLEGDESFRGVISHIREGIAFVRTAMPVRNAMVIDFWGTFLSGANALLPAFAGPILNLGPAGYGLLASAEGIGALCAASVLSAVIAPKSQGKWVIGMIAVYGVGTILFGISPSLPLAAIGLAIAGASDMISTVFRQTIRQLATPDDMRGRMSSVAMMFQMTGPQLGDFEAGGVADLAGERFSVVSGGIACALVAGWYALRGKALMNYRSAAPLIAD